MPSAAASAWVSVFGVRHLSPAGAWHLRRHLDQVRPEVLLIEGLADADGLIPDITRKDTHPPIAILAYTAELPVRTLLYPLARYSPEFQALAWAREHKVPVEFIDLPSDVFLALQEPPRLEITDIDADLAEPPTADAFESDSADAGLGDDADDGADDEAAAPADPRGSRKSRRRKRRAPHIPDDDVLDLGGHRGSLYEQFAREAGEPDYETYWERHFEHNCSDDCYRRAAFEFGSGLRELDREAPRNLAETIVRESYMRMRIAEKIAQGVPAEKIAAVVGAYHAPVLTPEHPAMTAEEFASLPRRESKLTLMPYSYFKLSSQSGYGAGNVAPAYFELLWDALEDGDLAGLPARYLSLVARHMRQAGTHRSTAEVIEGVRLACTLSALKGGLAPTLRDLRDAAVTLIGHGVSSAVQDALARVDVGTAIGRLPAGVSRTSIQDDFERELHRLKLEKYRTTVKQELALDLRENRLVKSEAAAFLDLHRSSFLHRLRLLGIGFAEPIATGQHSATWAEKWHVQWSPECEINLVEAVLLGETVELACGYKFKTQLESCRSVGEAARMVREACQCGLMSSMEQARRRLQELAAESSEFTAVAQAAHELGLIARYGDVRQFDPAPLLPLMDDLFVQGALALPAAANCDNEAAKSILVGMDELNKVNLEYHERVDEELWVGRLQALSDADDRNPVLSGYACAILLERNLIGNEDLAREVSRRLSPGVPADLGAGWFEGLAQRNRYALLARQLLWEQLADYVASLDDEQFRRAIVFLRRAFGGFSPQEKRHIAENLGEYWGVGADAASDLLNQPLTEQEQQAMEELNEFDFEDL